MPVITTYLLLAWQVDALLMKHFLSAFSDTDCVSIINHCKQCLAPSGAILLLQTLVPEPGDRDHNNTEDGVAPGEWGAGWRWAAWRGHSRRLPLQLLPVTRVASWWAHVQTEARLTQLPAHHHRRVWHLTSGSADMSLADCL